MFWWGHLGKEKTCDKNDYSADYGGKNNEGQID